MAEGRGRRRLRGVHRAPGAVRVLGHLQRLAALTFLLMGSLARWGQAKGSEPLYFVAARSPCSRRLASLAPSAPTSWARSLAGVRRRAPSPSTAWPLAPPHG